MTLMLEFARALPRTFPCFHATCSATCTWTVVFDATKAVGKVHGPVKTQFGFHLILIQERTAAEAKNNATAAVTAARKKSS